MKPKRIRASIARVERRLPPQARSTLFMMLLRDRYTVEWCGDHAGRKKARELIIAAKRRADAEKSKPGLYLNGKKIADVAPGAPS